MDFERTKIEKQRTHKIVLEIDVTGDIDVVKCQKIANNLAYSILSQLSILHCIEVICSNASVQPVLQRNYNQVQLPLVETTVSVVGRRK